MKIIAFFNNKGGVGKTTLVYHLAHMFALCGKRTLAVDLDPQSNLSSMCLDEETLIRLWDNGNDGATIHTALSPILRGLGDFTTIEPQHLHENLSLIPGDLALSRYEDKLSDAWPRCHNRDEAAYRTMTAFYRLIISIAENTTAPDIVLVDVGPNLGAINRAALIACDQVVTPMAPDLFSLQGLKNLGPTLREWRNTWTRLRDNTLWDLPIPNGNMTPTGYVILQHSMRDSRPVKAYQRWMERIPGMYRKAVLDEPSKSDILASEDPYCLHMLKHFRSLMPMAMEARKPMFSLLSADGAIGSHVKAVSDAKMEFFQLATAIARNAGLDFSHTAP